MDLGNQISTTLMRRIIAGEYAEGTSLPREPDLCAQFEVSRVVVREAKKRLQTLGMIRPLKHMGSYVQPMRDWNFFSSDLFALYLEVSGDAARQLENFYELRILMEPELAASVAVKHSAGFRDSMTAIIDRLEEVHTAPLGDELLELDLAYHLRMYEESGNIVLMPMANLMKPFFLFSFRYSGSEWDMGFAEHRDCADAILCGNAPRAKESMAKLINNGRKRFRAMISDIKRNSLSTARLSEGA